MKIRLSACLWLVLLLSGCSTDQTLPQLSVQASLDTLSASIGDIIEYQVTVKGISGRRIEFDEISPDTAILTIHDRTESADEEQNELRRTYHLAVWDTGTIVIPPARVNYYFPGDTVRRTISTDSLTLRVNSILAQGDGQLRPIKGPVALPMIIPWRTILLLLVLVLLFLAIMIVWRRRQSDSQPSSVAVTPREPADKLALRLLEDLRKRRLWEAGEFNQYYFALSQILRQYIEGSLYLKTLEMTTAEIVAQRDLLPYTSRQISWLLDFLQRADLIKFARRQPTHDDCRNDLAAVIHFIRTTLIYWKVEIPAASDSKFESQ